MRYILNFNEEAVSLIGTSVYGLNIISKENNSLGASIALVPNTEGAAFSPVSADSNRFKTRFNAETARSVGLRGSQRYTLRAGRGKNPTFFLVPHSQVRHSKSLSIDGPAVTVSITERAA